MTGRPEPAAESRSAATTPIKVLLALGGFAALAIALEGARSWSWWVGALLAQWHVGGEPAAPEMFIYPAFFTAILALSRAAPASGSARFLGAGLLWSAALFLADPALRAAFHAIDPALVETNGILLLRGTLLYALLFGWMYLTFRRLVPRAEADDKPTPDKTGKIEKAGPAKPAAATGDPHKETGDDKP